MKHLIIAAAMLGASLSAQAQTNVSIQVGQPGFYGRIDLGDLRQPPVVYAQPVIIERHARLAPEPLYLRVPPGHMKKWSKHCGYYNACGRQVYFVRDDWYTNTYVPHYREVRGGRDHRPDYRPDHRPDYRPGYPRDHRSERVDRNEHRDYRERHDGRGRDDHRGGEERRDERRDERNERDHGNGNGHGNGHGKH